MAGGGYLILMEYSGLKTANVPELEPGLWRRVVHWLGSIGSRTERGENKTVDHHGQAAAVPSLAEVPQPTAATEFLRRSFEKLQAATQSEAGRPEGRSIPAFIAGEQVYRNPKVWGPTGLDVPLMQDEAYRDALALDTEILRLGKEDDQRDRERAPGDTQTDQ